MSISQAYYNNQSDSIHKALGTKPGIATAQQIDIATNDDIAIIVATPSNTGHYQNLPFVSSDCK